MSLASEKKRESQNLPIGIHTFEFLREDNCYYVDKTDLIDTLIKKGRYYFLSRPRRFGKSLLLDTIQCLFEARKSLFEDLAIYDQWDWSKTQPVLRLSLGLGKLATPETIEESVLWQLSQIEEKSGLVQATTLTNSSLRLADVLSRLKKTTGKNVVVLIDEYDKPILDVLHQPEKAMANHSYLKDLYSILKERQQDIHFLFITGISLFSKLNLFSGLNNLHDISMDPDYATLCGYTERDLTTVFAPEVARFSLAEIRRWYDGYCWDIKGEGDRLFSPHSVLRLFKLGVFDNWWYKDCIPQHCYELLASRHITAIELTDRWVSSNLLSRFSVGETIDIDTDTLLFQSGYLTIREAEQTSAGMEYRLTYPNIEVQQSLSRELLEHWARGKISVNFRKEGEGVLELLASGDTEALLKKLQAILAGLPYLWHDRLKLGDCEALYASILFAIFSATHAHVQVEEVTRFGRSDMVIRHKNQIFVMEFKYGEDSHCDRLAQEGVQQIKSRAYGDKYLQEGQRCYLVVMVFGSKERQLLKIILEDFGAK